MSDQTEPLHLFEGYGIEMEYMLVQEPELNIFPAVDKLFMAVSDEKIEDIDDIDRGDIAWCNELVLHVVELKTNGPVSVLNGLVGRFQDSVNDVNRILTSYNGKLMPTGAHPWMEPDRETKLWPYGYQDVYSVFNKIFNCRGHGWSNLQSTHLNLPFANDAEFAVLHTAIRLLLPLMSALAASTPIIDGIVTGFTDTRLQYYLTNQAKIPSITGHVVPEVVFSRLEYEEKILRPIYNDIAPYDPNKILQFEWLNSRGAIARFDRNAIEIRTLDIQECPQADLGIIALIVATLRAITEERWDNFASQAEWSERALSQIWRDVIKDGQDTVIQNSNYLNAFGFHGSVATVRDLWQHIYTQVFNEYEDYDLNIQHAAEVILKKGNLSERILRHLEGDFRPQAIREVYRELTSCLAEGRLFG